MADDWQLDRVREISALVKRAEPDAVVEPKWRKRSNPDGVPTFSLDGLICTVEILKNKVKITFNRDHLSAILTGF